MERGKYARKKILDEFYKLACNQGYKRTSMRQLSDACGMSKGHINFYFKKKEDLMIVLCEKYHTAANTAIADCENIPDDETVKFLLHQLLLCYFICEEKHALRFISEMAENSIFLIWRAKTLSGYIISMLEKENIYVDKDDIFDACLVSMSGIYAFLHRKYVKKIHFEYEKMFRMFMKVLFACISIDNIDLRIETALRVFADLDRESLQSRFDSALR